MVLSAAQAATSSMRRLILLPFLFAGCAVTRAPAPLPRLVAPATIEAPAMQHAALSEAPAAVLVEPEPVPQPVTEESDDGLDDPSGDVAEEEEAQGPVSDDPNRIRYSTELSDEDLAEKWKSAPETLGSMSVGFAHDGRLINGTQFPRGDGSAWVVISPHSAWATSETIDYVIAAAQKVKELHPEAHALRVNGLSGKDGGYLRPHRSHQNGRDVDLGFYYPTVTPPRVREREKVIDVAQNWALVKALVTLTDVQTILLDKRVSAVLVDHALKSGEDPDWLASIFTAPDAIVQHAPRHRDHFHVRFYNGRAQELGRRVAPLLAQRPEHNWATVRVKNGDTLGAIAIRHGTSIRAIQKANRLKGSFLRIAQVLRIPLRGACTRCPVPPAVEVPPRRLPPEVITAPLGPTATATDTMTFSSLR